MGNITDKISKEQFDIAYDNHQPSSWIKFAYKYFSKSTEKKNYAIRNSVVFVLVVLFLVGFLSVALKLPHALAAFAVTSYSIILTTLVLYLFSAVFLNNYRIRLIRKELGINKDEYDALISVYYP